MEPLLITLSHGSRCPGADRGSRALTSAAAARCATTGVSAFLELATPSLPEVARVLPAGTPAVVVPLLFSAAHHANVDVPAAVAAARDAGLKARATHGLGFGSETAGVLRDVVNSEAPAGADLALYSVGSSHADANAQVQELAAELGELTGRTASLVTATNGPDPAGRLAELAAAAGPRGLHLVPLFVTSGLLLDRLVRALPRVQDATGVTVTRSGPLATRLADVVADRFRSALIYA